MALVSCIRAGLRLKFKIYTDFTQFCCGEGGALRKIDAGVYIYNSTLIWHMELHEPEKLIIVKLQFVIF